MPAFPEPSMPSAPGDREPGLPEPELPDQATLHQDTYRKVLLGQASDPIFPPHPAPPEVSEEELAAQALSDPGACDRDAGRPVPPLWRWLFLVALALASVGIVLFWKP